MFSFFHFWGRLPSIGCFVYHDAWLFPIVICSVVEVGFLVFRINTTSWPNIQVIILQLQFQLTERPRSVTRTEPPRRSPRPDPEPPPFSVEDLEEEPPLSKSSLLKCCYCFEQWTSIEILQIWKHWKHEDRIVQGQCCLQDSHDLNEMWEWQLNLAFRVNSFFCQRPLFLVGVGGDCPMAFSI